MTGKIELTEQEADALIGMIDVAVKVDGLKISAIGSIIHGKILAAFKDEAKVVEMPKEEE